MNPAPGDIITAIDGMGTGTTHVYKVYLDATTALAAGEHIGGQWVSLWSYFEFAKEGVEWCHGTEGPEVDALLAAHALR